MTIGTNDILNTSIEITKEKSVKKDYTTEDFSVISNQFAGIFNNQFMTNFQNQFNYNQTNKKTDFMANMATSMTENKYYPPSNNVVNQNTEQQTVKYQQNNEQSKSYASDSKVENSSSTQQNVEQNQKQTQNQTEQPKTETTQNSSTQTDATTEEKTTEPSKTNSEVEDKTDAAATDLKGMVSVDQNAETEKAEALKVKIKDKELKKVNELTEETQLEVSNNTDTLKTLEDNTKKISTINTTEKSEKLETSENLETKTIKIEDIKVNTNKKEVSEKEEKEDSKVDKKAEIKTETQEVPKESIERLTANVLEGATEENNTIKKLLNKDINKNATSEKEHNQAKSAVEFKNPAAFTNQNSEQNSGSNPNSQNSSKHTFLKELLPFDASSVMKNTINTHTPFHGVMQNNQTNTIMQKNIAEQVMNQIKSKIDSETTQLSMILKPENIGKVTLNIMNERGVLSAEIKTESREAAEALNKNINDLKETLKQQGVVCTNLVVKVEESQKSETQANLNQQQDNSPKNFEQGGNAQNSNEGTFQNSTHKNTNTAKTEIKQNIQEEQDTQAQTKAEDKGLVDYRV